VKKRSGGTALTDWTDFSMEPCSCGPFSMMRRWFDDWDRVFEDLDFHDRTIQINKPSKENEHGNAHRTVSGTPRWKTHGVESSGSPPKEGSRTTSPRTFRERS
jgi:hypothetical protein